MQENKHRPAAALGGECLSSRLWGRPRETRAVKVWESKSRCGITAATCQGSQGPACTLPFRGWLHPPTWLPWGERPKQPAYLSSLLRLRLAAGTFAEAVPSGTLLLTSNRLAPSPPSGLYLDVLSKTRVLLQLHRARSAASLCGSTWHKQGMQ